MTVYGDPKDGMIVAENGQAWLETSSFDNSISALLWWWMFQTGNQVRPHDVSLAKIRELAASMPIVEQFGVDYFEVSAINVDDIYYDA